MKMIPFLEFVEKIDIDKPNIMKELKQQRLILTEDPETGEEFVKETLEDLTEEEF